MSKIYREGIAYVAHDVEHIHAERAHGQDKGKTERQGKR
jgi:hypothetical protein